MTALPDPAAAAKEKIERGADLSADRKFRYRLWRRWGSGLDMAVIGVNPSTADENEDDATIRRCVGFARREGYGGLLMLNLFAYRATDPKDLERAGWPMGAANLEHIIVSCAAAGVVVAAWGDLAPLGTAQRVRANLHAAGVKLWCWGRTKSGAPRHPSRLPNTAKLEPL
jgi:hypothetical protein